MNDGARITVKPARPEDLAVECSALDLHFALAFDHALSIIHA
jgi:hypothetical protein